jgi:hypothetical protein
LALMVNGPAVQLKIAFWKRKAGPANSGIMLTRKMPSCT